MSLLKQASEEIYAEREKAAQEQKEAEAARVREQLAEQKRKGELFQLIQELIEEDDVKIIQHSEHIAALIFKNVIVGYFAEEERSGSEYVSEYGCDVPWHYHYLHLTRNESSFDKDSHSYFRIDIQYKTPAEITSALATAMVAFYKSDDWRAINKP